MVSVVTFYSKVDNFSVKLLLLRTKRGPFLKQGLLAWDRDNPVKNIWQNFVLHKHEDSALKFCINLDRTVLTGCFILCLLIGRKRWCLSSVALSPTFQLLQKIGPTLAIWSHNLFRASNDCDCPRPQRLLSHMCLQEPISFTQRIVVVGDWL